SAGLCMPCSSLWYAEGATILVCECGGSRWLRKSPVDRRESSPGAKTALDAVISPKLSGGDSSGAICPSRGSRAAGQGCPAQPAPWTTGRRPGPKSLELAGQLGAQTQHRLGVQLRDARLGDAEHFADLSERQVLVVVEGDDQLLPFGQR